ncbi:LysR family transcriptional regulator [Pyramidobacter sp.]|uniref:LysR family transcriptional regulator n=1 Tax=Pyramidobacter sp. TaxID=1943581 RepID=UPI0033285CFD
MDNVEYFIALAEELNFCKAAKRVYITQQSMSSYLKNLEEQYHATLFFRHPRMRLTAAGEKLLTAYKRISKIQASLAVELANRDEKQKGKIVLGIHSGRARFLLPRLLPEYSRRYPNIKIQIEQNLTASLEKGLLMGDIDVFIGTTPVSSPYIQYKPLAQEQICIVVSDEMLRKCFPESYPDCLARFQNGIGKELLSRLPLGCSVPSSRLRQIFDAYLCAENICVMPVVECSGTDILLNLCRKNYCAAICSELYIRDLLQQQEAKKRDHLHAFPIRGLKERRPLIIAWLKEDSQPPYLTEMIGLISSIFSAAR